MNRSFAKRHGFLTRGSLQDYIRARRTKCSDEKAGAYKRIMIILRDLAEVPFSKFNNLDLVDNLLILIKNCDRLRAGKNELRKVLKHYLKWKFKDLSLIENIRLEKDFNEKKFNSNTMPKAEEIEKILRTTKSLKVKAMITLQYELALRPQEIQALKWKHFKFLDTHGEVEIFANKTSHVRVLPFKDCLIHILRWKKEFEYPDRKDDDYVFPSHNRNKPLQRQYLGQLYRRLCIQAGQRVINPYLVRHGTLSNIYKKTKDSRLTARFGGHSLKTSEIYVNLGETEIKDIILEQVYNTKEPDIKTKHALEIKIGKQDEVISEMKKDKALSDTIILILAEREADKFKGKKKEEIMNVVQQIKARREIN